MSIKLMNAVWEGAPYSEGTLLVLLALADWASDQGDNLYPTIRQVMDKARLKETGARDCLKRLMRDGVLRKVTEAPGTPGVANRYALNVAMILGWESICTGSGAPRVRKAEGFVSKGVTGSVEGQTGSVEVPCIDKPPSITTNETIIAEPDGSETGLFPEEKKTKKKNPTTKTAIGDYRPGPDAQAKAVAYWQARGRPDLVALLADEVDGFVAYHRAHGSRMADWDAAWQTRYVNAVTFNKPPSANGHGLRGAPPGAFQGTDEDGWRRRMKIFYGLDGDTPGWHPGWGPKPGEPGCKVPENVLREVRARHQ